MNPLFSVVVPVFNIEKYIFRCLKSIHNQAYDNYEVIVVDDGSTDRSPQICDDFCKYDERYKVIHKKNGGVVSARQTGVSHAIGDYIICIDGDDEIEKNYLCAFAKAADKSSADVICCGYIEESPTDQIKRKMALASGSYNKSQIEEYIFPYLFEDKYGNTFSPSLWAKAFKRKMFLDIHQRLDPRIHMGEDSVVCKAIISKSESLYIIEEYLYYYHYNASSITKGKSCFAWDGPLLKKKFLEQTVDLSQSDFSEQIYRYIYHALFVVCASQFRRNESYSIIAKDIIQHLRHPEYKEILRKSVWGYKPKLLFKRACLELKMVPLLKWYCDKQLQ